jgi:geranylgeranyl reductase family protein
MTYDVVVVGAGPAGAWAAFELARRGARVALVDASHPREKPCGGGVTGRALALVGSELAQVPRVSIETARFTALSAGASVDVALDPGALVIASRTEFDAALVDAAERAGARLIKNRARNVAPEGNGFRITTASGSLRTQVLVGADGANSLVRRRLSQPFGRNHLSIATGFFVPGVTSRQIVIGLNADPPGYFWSFPRPTHLAIGVCAQANVGVGAATLRAAVAAWIERSGLANGAPLTPYAWPIPSLSNAALGTPALAGPGWFLVGDAAGLVDPLTREGIYFALLSGSWAAEAIASDLASGERQYRQRVRDEILVELARAARLKAGFFRPEFTHLVIDALRQSAAIRRVMASLVAGDQTYAGLKSRLMRTREFRLAGRFFLGAARSLLSRQPGRAAD